MTLKLVLNQLAHRKIQLCVDGSELACRRPRGVFTAEIQESLAMSKPALLVRMTPNPDATDPKEGEAIFPKTTVLAGERNPRVRVLGDG